MALVEKTLGAMSFKTFREFVVVGDRAPGCTIGDIRWVEWSRFLTSPMLRIEFADAEKTQLVSIDLAPEFKKRGWKLLRDLFTEDPEAAGNWKDYERFSQAQVDNPSGMKERPFPAEMLPKKLRDMQALGALDVKETTDFEFSNGAKLSELEAKPSEAEAKFPRRAAK